MMHGPIRIIYIERVLITFKNGIKEVLSGEKSFI